jgi:hypothetical protein
LTYRHKKKEEEEEEEEEERRDDRNNIWASEGRPEMYSAPPNPGLPEKLY